MRIALAFAFALIACTSTKPPPAKPDAPGSDSMRTCTGAAYDPCTANSQCTSMNCHFYMMSNFTVCTVPCSATNPCPMDAAGMAGTCNMMGMCKPTVANTCTP